MTQSFQSREEYEQLAIEVVPASDYYELLDNMDSLSDEDLIDIINKYKE